MSAIEINLPQDSNSDHLTTINGIKFSPREIDIVSSLVAGRSTKKIAHFLSLSPRTVENYVYNIMSKLGFNSRQSIIDFIEKSDKFSLIKTHYENLLIHEDFKRTLKDLSKLIPEKNPSCLLVCWPQQPSSNSLSSFIAEALRYIGITFSKESQESDLSFSQLFNESEKNTYKIYIFPPLDPSLLEGNTDLHSKSHNTIILILGEEHRGDASKEFEGVNFINFSKQKNVYFAFFEILKLMLPQLDLKNFITDFEKKYEGVRGTHTSRPPRDYVDKTELIKNKTWAIFDEKHKKWIYASSFLFLTLFCIGTFLFFANRKKEEILTHFQNKIESKKENILVRNDLAIPSEATFLNRPELLSQLNSKFKGEEGIQSIAIIGIGGSGKTTLARQYARSQKTSLVWEINAETQESLKRSFENLAEVLAKTDEDKRELRGLEEIQDPAKQEEKRLQFVKNRLKLYKNWVLIYDNVERFQDIQPFLPKDPLVWGQGKVILTTRDNNIQNNTHIMNALQMRELIPNEKLHLFLAIMEAGGVRPLTLPQREEAKKFLEGIPPFPLDISVAAYYLKATHVPYQKYLESMTLYNKDFASAQENLLKESSDYTNTRYGIITLSLQHLMNTDKDFGDLFLFLSLLDSQNIPIELLNMYKNDLIVSKFIYNLKKYSLITNESTPFSSSASTLSMHLSTQDIGLEYLVKALNLNTHKERLRSISNILDIYLGNIIEKQDIAKMKPIVSHCERFLSHQNLLTDNAKALISGDVGYVYFYLGKYKKAKNLLEESVSLINNLENKDYYKKALFLIYLGDVYNELGESQKAKETLEQGLMLYKETKSENDLGVARGLASLGNVHRRLGEYEKAREAFEHSLVIYKQYLPEKYMNLALILGYLGNIYREFGNYEKARDVLEESLAIYKDHLAENTIGVAQSLANLGNVYRQLGNYEKAISTLEKSIFIYKHLLSENHVKVAWVLGYLGNTYKDRGNYKKAEEILEQSLSIYKKNLPPNHVSVAWGLMNLGNLYKDLGYDEKAKDTLEQSLAVYKMNLKEPSPRMARALASLGNVYTELSQYEKAKELLDESLSIQKTHLPKAHIEIAETFDYLGNLYGKLGEKHKAKYLLEQSYFIFENHFGKDHIEAAKILRDQGNIYLLEGNLDRAHSLFKNALAIYQKNNHPNSYVLLEDLAALSLKQTEKAESKRNIQLSEKYKAQAISDLTQALNIVKESFPQDSPHLMRIQSKVLAISK